MRENHREPSALGGTCLRALGKMYDDAQKSICKVWTLNKLIIQGGALKLGDAV